MRDYMDMARRVGCVGMLLAVVLSIGAQAALAQDKITNDPFVREQIRREHWEPGGRYWPSNFQNRGSVIPSSRSGVVTPIMVSSQRVGNLLIQTAQISGQYNYTIDLSSHHPHSVHSPFDRTASASDSATEESQTKSVTVNLAWTSLYNHPANGYDAPQGGGYPTPDPRGAVDHFTHTITGSAVGQYIMTSSDWQRFDPPPAHTILTNAMVTDSSNPFLNVVGSPGDNASSSKDSLNDLLKRARQNPTQQNLSDIFRRGLAVGDAISDASKALQGVADSSVAYGIGEITGMGFDSPAWQGLASKLHNAEKIAKGADKVGKVLGVLKYVKFALDGLDIATADTPDDFGEAVNQLVRDSVTTAAGWAGAKGGALGGGIIGAHFAGVGALVGAPVGALIGYFGASYAAEAAYDAWAAEDVTSFATDYYRQNYGTGSLASHAGSSLRSGFQNVTGGGGGAQ